MSNIKKYKYTNKEEIPIPKYKNGDIAWYIDSWLNIRNVAL